MINTSQFYANSHYDHHNHQIHQGKRKQSQKPQLQFIENKSGDYIEHNQSKINKNKNSSNTTKKLYHTISSATGRPLTDFFVTLGSKTPTQYLCEKFIKLDLLNNYDNLKQSYKNFPHTTSLSTSSSSSSSSSTPSVNTITANSKSLTNQEQSNGLSGEGGIWNELNCLQGIYRSNSSSNNSKWEEAANASKFYEAVNINGQPLPAPLPPTRISNLQTSNMISKSSHNFLADNAAATVANDNAQSGAVLQNFQKLPECDQDLPKDTASSGPSSSSSEFTSDNSATRNSAQNSRILNKLANIEQKKGSVRIYVDAAPIYSIIQNAANESASENSSSSIAATTTTTYSSSTVQRTSSASSSGEYNLIREGNKKGFVFNNANHHHHQYYHHQLPCNKSNGYMMSIRSDDNSTVGTRNEVTERLQRRKLMQIISSLEQQNKLLQRDLTLEKKRRADELSRVVKQLLCFESKLKSDMKVATQRMQEKDVEICRLTRQNRALKKAYVKTQHEAKQTQDEGVVTDDSLQLELIQELDEHLLEDCLVLEALQCINCRKQFYDIGIKETQNISNNNNSTEGSRTNDDHTTEHGSSSDDTVSSSFYGARRSVRYTSKRTTGTFREYMRSRDLHVDDVINWENTSTLSRDSQTSTASEKDNVQVEKSIALNLKNNQVTAEEDDGIFSPTQDDDDDDDEDDVDDEAFEEAVNDTSSSLVSATNTCVKTVEPRASEFSEASPKQIYETSADDWYASASDQEDIGDGRSTKGYTLAAVNPVLECVNQILLQQSMEEPVSDKIIAVQTTTTNETQTSANLPRRSSLSGRRSNGRQSSSSDVESMRNKTLTRKRVHFSTKNSMVHLPRHETDNEEEQEMEEHVNKLKLNTTSFAINSIPNYQKQQQQKHQHTLIPCYPTTYFSTITTSPPQQATMIKIAATTGAAAGGGGGSTTRNTISNETNERLETPNYESIYSNEYEPIGSERNSSNLYVEMETECSKVNDSKMNNNSSKQESGLVVINNNTNNSNNNSCNIKLSKTPPALPPKPANLIKFKKSSSLQQDDQKQQQQDNDNIKDKNDDEEENNSVVSEPDYCSIAEITSVQIITDVHKAPESLLSGNNECEIDGDDNFNRIDKNLAKLLDAADDILSVVSDETCGAASQKTEEIEEIFADIPKLPNVAAIIAPKYQAKYQMMKQHQQLQKQQQQLQLKKQQQLLLHQSKTKSLISDYLTMSPKNDAITTKSTSTPQQFQAVQNLLINTSTADISSNNNNNYGNSPVTLVIGGGVHQKIISNNNSNVTTITNKIPKIMTATTTTTTTIATNKKVNNLLKEMEAGDALPLQAEFDWYNLDAEYGKAATGNSLLVNGKNEHKVQNGLLTEIHEDHECEALEPHVTITADEYNLDEEFSLISEQQPHEIDNHINTDMKTMLSSLRTKKLHRNSNNSNKNRETFEKFIEGSGLSTKPLPHKRKIYFAGPYV